MRRSPACLTLLAVVAVACSSLTGPGGERARLMAEDPAAELSAWVVRPGSDPIPALRVDGGAGAISFQGALGTPYPCYDVDGYVERQRSRLHLEIVATRRPVACIAVVATFAYRGEVGRLAPGAYQVQVTHVVDGRRMPVLEATVAVH